MSKVYDLLDELRAAHIIGDEVAIKFIMTELDKCMSEVIGQDQYEALRQEQSSNL